MRGWQYYEQPAKLDDNQLIAAISSVAATIKYRASIEDVQGVNEAQERLYLLCVECEHRLSGLGYDSGE